MLIVVPSVVANPSLDVRLDLGNSNGHSASVIGALKDAAENFGYDIEHFAGKEPSTR